MATDAIAADPIRDFFADLEARKSLLTTCTDLYKTLTDHFEKLQQTLRHKSQALESKIEAFDSETRQTLESLDRREGSIPERESGAATRVEELRQSAISELENPAAGSGGFSEVLRSYCRRMDVSGLVRFLLSKRKESATMRSEMAAAMEEAVDAQRLVLDAVEEFLGAKAGRGGVADRRWACGVLMQAVFPLGELEMGKHGVAGSMAERAAEVAEKWKGVIAGEGGVVGAAEAAMFLHMVCGFKIVKRFEQDFMRKMVVEHAARRDMAKIALALGFGEKMKEMIEELVKDGKEIEAVYFAFESGLTEQFRPIPLLKLYLSNSRKTVNAILKNGNSSATEHASNLELNSCKAIIKCVEDYKLQSGFNIDNLKKRVAQLEKSKSDKKKNSVSTSKPMNKRNRGGNSRDGGHSAFRQPKAGRYSNYSPSFSHRNIPQHQASATRYSTPPSYYSQGAYEGSSAVPYGSGYVAPHSQSPAAMPQQYSSYPPQDVGAGGVRNPGSYGVQPNYGVYDYNAGAAGPHAHPQPHPPAYPQSYPQ